MSETNKGRIGILGGGSWGTALAILWSRNGHHVDLWVRNKEAARAYREMGRNGKYLPDYPFPNDLHVRDDLRGVLADNDLIFMAVPLQAYRALLSDIAEDVRPEHEFVLLSKGIEIDTHNLPSQIIGSVLGEAMEARCFTLSGPSFAKEVAEDMPTTVVLAGKNQARLETLQHHLNCPSFRLYRNDDVVGVELCGALKNVVAIAAGICTGLGLGLNTLSALITRGLAEISRLGVTMGAQQETFAGLAGMGDLILTCNGTLSRNLRVGMALAQGHTLQTILQDLGMVAEGVATAQAARQLSEDLGVELPISNIVYRIIYEELAPRDGLRELMSRGLKSE